jgi:hypothetical protein
MDAIPEEGPIAKQITELEEGGSPHPKKLHIATIVAMVDEPKVAGPFFISGTQRSVGNSSPRGGKSPESNKQPGSDHSDQCCAPTDKLQTPSEMRHGAKQEIGHQLLRHGPRMHGSATSPLGAPPRFKEKE